VTGVDGSVSGTAGLTVSMLDHLVLSPGSATVVPGTAEVYRAEGFDALGRDLGDVTAATTFTISPDGSCSGSSCSAAVAGPHTVTGADGSASGTASLTVTTAYVELTFSRTEVTAADGPSCQADDTNVARLDTTVAPYLQSLGLAATGSIETGPTQTNSFWCAHFGETLATSWTLTQQLAAAGWTFATHSLDYPNADAWAAMTPGQQWDETCGAAQTIDSHGLRGAADDYLWPNNVVNQTALTSFVEPCFGTNRTFGSGINTGSQLAVPPYRLSVQGISGGACASTTAQCHSVPGTITTYKTPAQIIALIQALQPGQVLSLQLYLLVTGTSPAYTTNQDTWDCTSPDPTLHWSNDAERYCWSDFQTILQYLASSRIGIVQPGTVNATFGRTGYSDTAVVRPS
jgi:hypothetical protein